jgi:hypothetical protein
MGENWNCPKNITELPILKYKKIYETVYEIHGKVNLWPYLQ